MTKTITPESIRTALAKLRVDKGGRGTTQRLSRDVEIGLHEHSPDPNYVYALTLRKVGRGGQARRQTRGLPSDAVYSKTRSAWRRDRVWRLTPETVEKYTENLAGLLCGSPSD